MANVTFKHHGNFSTTKAYLSRVKNSKFRAWLLKQYGEKGVKLLQEYTPKRTGLTANSWIYEIDETKNKNSIRLVFSNTNIHNNVPIAIIIQNGHATRNGGWVEGVDYINPALTPIFEKLADDMWKQVRRA